MEIGLLYGFFILLLFLSAPLLGYYTALVFADDYKGNIPILSYLEKLIIKITSVRSSQEMTWPIYGKALIYFNLIGLLFLFMLLILQQWLPLNPQNFPAVEPSLAFNAAISFVTNTNWQAYAGETTMSYFTQMVGFTVQNFLSAATGNAVLLALIRGIMRTSSQTIGNFWIDLIRTVVYVLLPLSFFFSIFLITQGVIQNFDPYVEVSTLEGGHQTIPMGPVASQISIKQLGTNGGGFFKANGAHPFENPTPLTNFFEAFAIVLIPASAAFMYGYLIKLKKHGWMIFSVMFALWALVSTAALISESIPNPTLNANPVLEGKETRIGIAQSILWTVNTTATSNGSTNNAHSSLSPMAGGIAIFNMMVGETIFGGLGVGLCSMIMFILLTVFMSGLMIGKSPSYLGKKIEKIEMQWMMVAILIPTALTLLGAGIDCLIPHDFEILGPHTLSGILYTFSTVAANNGSSFGGEYNNAFYNITFGLIMLLSRLAILIPSLAISGNLSKKSKLAQSAQDFSTDRPIFAILLFSIILVVSALTFFPALSLGPLMEQILMLQGRSF